MSDLNEEKFNEAPADNSNVNGNSHQAVNSDGSNTDYTADAAGPAENAGEKPEANPESDRAQGSEATYHYSYVNGNTQNPDVNPNAYNPTGSAAQSGEYNPNNQSGGQQSAYVHRQTGYRQQQTYYTPPYADAQRTQASASSPDYSQMPTDEQEAEKKPKKKNASAKIIAIVIAICAVIAVAGIVLTATGVITSSSSSNSMTSQSDGSKSDVQTKDSNSVQKEDSDGNLTVAGVTEKVIDSCVGITVYSQQQDAYNYFYGYGSNNSSSSEQTESGEGSGIIMSENNGKTYILTCAHVISDGTSFKVTLNDKTEYDATMVAYDSQTDIGVLSINATGLQVAEFAKSDNLAVGEQVVAIGCPGGLEFMNSVTSGYISALDRPISSTIGYNNKCIQVDAAINPGNSGGALFNMQGQVIGVNSSKIAATDYEGMGFAVPSDTAISTANSLINSGYVEGRAKIGITYNTLTSYNNYSSILSALEEKGYKDAKGTMVINSVDGSSDLASKDIKQYDMIVAINGETMTSTDVLTSVLADSKPGDTVKLTIARIENNEIKISEVECKLMESKGDSSSSSDSDD